jgi:hypothetical protein
VAFSKLFKSKPQADPRIRWFGKLPSYGDYYSSPPDADWVVEFNDWILKGFELYQSRARSGNLPMKRLPISVCIVRLPQSGMTVFASVLDFGGDMRGRPFPICFYVGFPTPQWPGPTSGHIPAAARAMRALTALRRDVGHFLNSPGRFESSFADMSLTLSDIAADGLSDSWRTEGRSLGFSQWFEAATPGIKIDVPQVWIVESARWGQRVNSCEGKDFAPTLRFPLATKYSLEVQVAGWFHWLGKRMDLARRSLSLLVVGDLERETGQLVVVARPPVKDDFLLMTPLSSSLSYVDDLSALSAAPDATFASNMPRTWIDFVES